MLFFSGYPRLRRCHGTPGLCPHGDAVFNICLEVGSVEAVTARARRRGSEVLVPPTSRGGASWAVVRSPCENILHTLVNTQHCRGPFLPGFEAAEDSGDGGGWSEAGLTHIDHVTYVVRRGQSEAILAWYRDTCGMARHASHLDTEGNAGVKG